jgi:hypothetical protein
MSSVTTSETTSDHSTTTQLPTTDTTITTPTTKATTATTPTTQSVVTSSVTASTAPPTTQLVTSVVTATSNGTPLPPSTVVITKTTSPTPATSANDGTTATSSGAAATSSSASLLPGGSKSTSNGGLSAAGKTAIAVVIPVVVIALLVLAGLFLWRRRKQKKATEEERRKEMEAYGFNPNQDPSLPAVAGVADSEMGEDQSGYRGWGNTSTSNRKASTTLSGGQTHHSDGYSPGSPTQGTISDHSGDPIMGHKRGSTMDSETIGALGAAPIAGAGRSGGVHRGPSNASSHYSVGDNSNHSAEAPMPVSQEYYPDNAYFTPGPYSNEASYGQSGQPIIRENPARRNTRIQEPHVYPQQGTSGIAQNF